MTDQTCDLLIIGGGLTGLALAYLLRNEEIVICLIEARDRLGGRIRTVQGKDTPPLEMGATWLGLKHKALVGLLKELDIDVFKQELGDRAIYEPLSTSPPQLVQLPANDDPSYRICGGTYSLIEALAKHLDNHQIRLNEKVLSISESGDKMIVKTDQGIFESSIVVSTLPPYLFGKTIDIDPSLPEEVLTLLHQTHTWMGDSIKVSFTYGKPFWRGQDLSGTIFSNVGPIPEMYDHADHNDQQFALTGFLNGAYFSSTREERKALALKQLQKYYGDRVNDFIRYEEKVWATDPFTFLSYDSHILPHQNNGHAIFQQPLFNGKLIVGGAETAAQFPGYMDGAVRSARFVAQHLLNRN